MVLLLGTLHAYSQILDQAGWACQGSNTLAYYEIAATESFMKLGVGANVKKLFLSTIYGFL
jgi:hypothetical protein